MKSLFYLFILILSVSLMNCTSAKSQSKKDKKKNERCEENVSRYRPKFSGKDSVSTLPKEVKNTNNNSSNVTVTQPGDNTAQLQEKLDSMSVKNSQIKTGQGYRVLVYSGRSTEDVKAARTKIYQLIPTADIYSDFHSPNQRVKVGNCTDRLEAYNLLGQLKRVFPNALIIPDKIIIKAK